MKNTAVWVIVSALALFLVSPALALIIGFEKQYAGGGAGKVVFHGNDHNQAGVTCNDCHPDAFVMIRGASDGMTMQQIKDGKFCGVCHNGERAFAADDNKNCSRCHTK